MSSHGKLMRTARRIATSREHHHHAKTARRIEKLKAGIDRLSSDLYGLNDRDDLVRLNNFKTYRVQIVRSFVLYLQLSIENLLKQLLLYRLKSETKIFTAKQIKKLVDDMRSSEIVKWCGRLNLVTKRQYYGIAELNRVRNSCAHNWLLDIPRYEKDKRGKRMRVPIVRYKGNNLLNEEVFRNEFMPVYSKVYLKLLAKVWRTKGYL